MHAETTDDQNIITVIPPEAETLKKPEPNENRRKTRALLAYWIIGLCNNYGYVVMLTAANDIISTHTGRSKKKSLNRDCTYMSTGAILLADILPGLTIKILAPFLPFFINIRVAICVVVAAAGYLLVAFGKNIYISILGVILTSFCSGFGEATYLQYSSFYDKNVISSWSSGTGGAGVIGALSYSILQVVGMRTTLLIMLVIPLTMALSFWLLLPKPSTDNLKESVEIQNIVNQEELINPAAALKRKMLLIPGLMKYIIPFSLVYLFEYFINQGTFELIRFEDSFVSQEEQYRWLQVTYQIGVFLSRSSVNLFHIKQTWIMAVFQGFNVVIYTTEVIYYYIPNFYIVIALTLWEGLLGGSSYVNTFYRITTEVPEENKQFSMAITTFGDSIGIALAGAIAIYAHNKICDLPIM